MASTSPAAMGVAVPPKAQASPAVLRSSGLRKWLEGNLDKGRNKIFTERITVTPELAYMLLERNKDNRPIYPSKLDQLVDDMNHNRFKLNGQTIGFAKTGELNDGQHRLTAITKTNKPQDMLLVFGLERDSRFTVDTGKARSAGDHLALSGWPYATAIAAVARLAIAYEHNKGERFGRTGDISVAAIQERASSDKLLQECASFAALNAPKLRQFAPAKYIGVCFYLFANHKPDQAKAFFEKLKTGTDLTENSPIRLAREYILCRPKLGGLERTEIIMRAWNAWIEDKVVQKLQLAQKLPPIKG